MTIQSHDNISGGKLVTFTLALILLLWALCGLGCHHRGPFRPPVISELPTPVPPTSSPTLTPTPEPDYYEGSFEIEVLPSCPRCKTDHLEVGYYFSDGRYGDYREEVDANSTTYHAWARRGYQLGDDPWLSDFVSRVAAAANAGKSICLALDQQREGVDIRETIKAIEPFWPYVTSIEYADEPGWGIVETQDKLREMRRLLADLSLPVPSGGIGIVYTRDQILYEDALTAEGVDWVGIEAYVDAPKYGDGTPDIDVQQDWRRHAKWLRDFINQAKTRIPKEKKVRLVGQAYTRNGGWVDLFTVRQLQKVAYLESRLDSRVTGIFWFSWGRPSGCRGATGFCDDHPTLFQKMRGN